MIWNPQVIGPGLLARRRHFCERSSPISDFHQSHVRKTWEKPKELEVYGRAKRTTIDREITDHAIDFVKRKASAKQPFFAFLPYTQTHEPVDPHPDYKGRTGNGSFADVLAQTDAYVGELLDTIDKLGLKEDTIFIFTSDNGRPAPSASATVA